MKKNKIFIIFLSLISLILILALVIVMLVFNPFSKNEKSLDVSDYYEIENYVYLQALEYAKTLNYGNYVISINELKNNNYIKNSKIKDPISDKTCKGYVIIDSKETLIKGDAYIKCDNYKTKNYDSKKLDEIKNKQEETNDTKDKDEWIKSLKSDEVPTLLEVNLETTYNNSIKPGDNIDIYMKVQDNGELVMYGKLIEKINVKAVKDSSGEDVFKNPNEVGTPAYLCFGLKQEDFLVFGEARILKNVELVIVPYGASETIDEKYLVTSEDLKEYLTSNMIDIEND